MRDSLSRWKEDIFSFYVYTIIITTNKHAVCLPRKASITLGGKVLTPSNRNFRTVFMTTSLNVMDKKFDKEVIEGAMLLLHPWRSWLSRSVCINTNRRRHLPHCLRPRYSAKIFFPIFRTLKQELKPGIDFSRRRNVVQLSNRVLSLLQAYSESVIKMHEWMHLSSGYNNTTKYLKMGRSELLLEEWPLTQQTITNHQNTCLR